MGRLKWILLLSSMTILLTGCWDKVEINEQAFVIAIGLDKFQESEESEDPKPGEPRKPEDQPRNRYAITYTFPNTGVIAGKGEGDPVFRFTSVGKNLYDVDRLLATRIKNQTFFGHTQVIILGEELARDEELMREVLDAIERNPVLGRKISLLITPGKAADILGSEPPLDPKVGIYISDLIRQRRNTARIADADLGYILRSLHESKVAIAPRIVATEEEIKVAGTAVLKDYRMIGWLGEMETRAMMFMQDKIMATEISPRIEDKIIPVEVTESTTEMKVFERDGEIVTSFKIEMEGNLNQHKFGVIGETFEEAYIRTVERAVAKQINTQITETYDKVQKEYQADVVQVGEHLRKHKPDLWNQVKGQWEELYPFTQVEVSVNMKIRRIGVAK